MTTLRGFDVEAAHDHLARTDRGFAKWMRRADPIGVDARWHKPFDPVDALARAILFQQLSGKAASTIVGRVEQAVGSKRLTATALDRVDDAALRACGVSGNKTLALRDLAARSRRKEIPTLRRMAGMPDEEIVAALTPVRGIGRWTVEMLLIFRLGRPDVLPIDDLGVRKGAQLVDASEAMPTPKALLERGERWGPYRTLASLYLWRFCDLKSATTPVPRSQE